MALNFGVAVIVLQGATVRDLMQAFQRKVEKQCAKDGRTRHLSWYRDILQISRNICAGN